MQRFFLIVFVLAAACARTSGVAAGEPESDEKYIHLQLRVAEKGDWEVTGASEIPGKAVVSDAPIGDYVYEVRARDKTIAVESMPDPFETRGYGGPPGSPPGHQTERPPTATIVVKIPRFTLGGPLEILSIRLYKIDTGGSALAKIDATTLDLLKRNGRAQTLVEARGERLAAEIRLQGHKGAG